jgi:sarcosine oxidase, subunit gamma
MRELRAARSAPSITASGMLQALPPATRHILRGGAAARTAAEAGLGLEIPPFACRAATDGERAALWLGPDEWLLLAPEAQAAAVATALGAALGQLPHSLVDVSHRQTALRVSGPEAATLLASGCPLDLGASAFPVGMCTRTVLAKAEIVLWRIGEQAFHIEVARSFSAYASEYLAEAARGMV